MIGGTDVIVAGGVLVVAVSAGLIAHEMAHAFVLRLAGIEFTIEYLPNRTGGVSGALTSCPWAVVTPRPTGTESPWLLRTAALAPLALTVPVVLSIGQVPTTPAVTAAMIGWLACAIPSPQDFSVVFYADQLLEQHCDRVVTSVSRAD